MHLVGSQTVSDSTVGLSISQRSTIFSTSQDGVDEAGFYYSLYDPNQTLVGYTEYPTSGDFEIGWDLPTATEFLGGKGYKSTVTLYVSQHGLCNFSPLRPHGLGMSYHTSDYFFTAKRPIMGWVLHCFW